MRIRSRRVLLPEGERAATVVIEAGRIAAIETQGSPASAAHDLGDVVLMPGGVDTHVHCNEPGRTEWEGFHSATRAAAAGGITTLVDMPLNSIPATTDAAALRCKVEAMAGQLHVDVGLWGGVVPANGAALEDLRRAGVLGFKCFLSPSGVEEFPPVAESDLRAVAGVLARLGRPLLVHAEDPALLVPMPASTRQHADWTASRPASAEVSAIHMLGRVSAETGIWVHIVHVASAAALDAIEAARRGEARITAETCPHYLTFADEEIPDGATEYKCAPPLRSVGERAALRAAVAAGRLPMVVSDHSPAPASLKQQRTGDFAAAWGGIASLEWGLAATWTAIAPAGAGLADLASRMATAPAALAGLEDRKGAIRVGLDADLVAFDPDATSVVDPQRAQQRHPVTPYAGRTLRGRVHATWLRGECVFDGAAVLPATRGIWVRH